MRITNTPLLSIYNNYNSQAFGSSAREYKNITPTPAGSNVYTTTSLFRSDLDFGKLADIIITQFKNKDKVNIKCLAGADGSEAYSLAIALMERIPKSQYKKYFPIISIDKDPYITKIAQSGRINLNELDLERLSQNVTSGKKYFINPKAPIEIKNDRLIEQSDFKSYEPIKELRNAVVFKNGNLLNEMATLEDDSNSVILCRNVMPYFLNAHVSNIAYYAKTNLKEGSLFVIGKYDQETDIENYLYYDGFHNIDKNIFQSSGDKTHFYLR